jgi:prepilin-type N-terminal cleavage/methylation domain-containing protein
MRRIRSEEKGFTLIEVIVTLILVGITAALAGMWIVNVANGYVFAKMNANTVQKGQLAITRLAKEFASISSVDIGSSTGTSITYTRIDSIDTTPVTSPPISNIRTLTISAASGLLTLGGWTLTDSVDTFSLSYCDDNLTSPTCSSSWSTTKRIIEVTLKLQGADNTLSEFKTRAIPRNL